MQVVVYTSLGTFKSKMMSLTNEEKENILDVLNSCARGDKTYLKFDTVDGTVIFGEKILREAVFCFVDNKKTNHDN